ncbi:MAG: multifunctional 2-oxoglutarate metabolism enzyme, partial [Ilumatobacteraceae bacterium]
MTAIDSAGPGFGANSWLVEEMYEQFRSDPGSVSEAWQEFFSDYKPQVPATVASPSPPAAEVGSTGQAANRAGTQSTNGSTVDATPGARPVA